MNTIDSVVGLAQLGFTSGADSEDFPTIGHRIKFLYEQGHKNIEIGFTKSTRLSYEFTAEDITILSQFQHVSIHTPVVGPDTLPDGTKDWVRYPSERGNSYLQQVFNLMQRVNINTVLFHPDLVDDSDLLNNMFGDKLAFENMDAHKSFGKTAEDMQEIFVMCPNAGWVCDVNHIYTIDPTMRLSMDMHNVLAKKRLRYYHLSAFGGWHSCFYNSSPDEQIILSGVLDNTKPIIHEGGATHGGRKSYDAEMDFFKKYYTQLEHGYNTN